MRDDPRDDAERAISDLNMAGAILALCESSLFRSQPGHRFEQRISKLCREHMQLQLRAYDKARSRP